MTVHVTTLTGRSSYRLGIAMSMTAAWAAAANTPGHPAARIRQA